MLTDLIPQNFGCSVESLHVSNVCQARAGVSTPSQMLLQTCAAARLMCILTSTKQAPAAWAMHAPSVMPQARTDYLSVYGTRVQSFQGTPPPQHTQGGGVDAQMAAERDHPLALAAMHCTQHLGMHVCAFSQLRVWVTGRPSTPDECH